MMADLLGGLTASPISAPQFSTLSVTLLDLMESPRNSWLCRWQAKDARECASALSSRWRVRSSRTMSEASGSVQYGWLIQQCAPQFFLTVSGWSPCWPAMCILY